MRTRFLGTMVVIAMLAMPALALSQSASAVRVGVLVGINSATVAGDDADDAERLTRMLGGVYLIKDLANGWALRPELLYSQKGAKAAIDGDGAAVDTKVKLDYFDVPVLLQYEATGSGEARPHVYVGPSFGFNLKCELEGSQSGVSVTLDCDDADVDIKSLDMGGIIGGGVSFPLGGLRGTLGGRYQHGFTDLESDAKVKNRVLSVYVGIEFGKK